jgi:outer membrane biosynthesis protein TonB
VTQPQPKSLTEILKAQQARLADNVKCLTDIQTLHQERASLVDKIEKASMFEKASLITEAVTFSLDIEARVVRALGNLTRLAHDELAPLIQEHLAQEGKADQETVQETDPETEATDQETVQETETPAKKPAKKPAQRQPKPAAKREEPNDVPTD